MRTAIRSRPGVLVVDDSPTTCLFIASTLEQAGYDVEVAFKGQECFTKVMKFQPNCLILDVMLPDISGYAVCRHVQQCMQDRRLYIVLISAKNAPLDQSYGLRQGANRYLPKPFTAEILVQTVCEGVPAPGRHAVRTTMQTAPKQSAVPSLRELIPHRVENTGTMRTSNPFTLVPAIADKQARQLYAVIDGRKTLGELSAMTGLNAEAVARPLRVLLKENCIRIYDTAGRPADDALAVN